MAQDVLVTVIFPCLNEEAAIGSCVDQARAGLASAGLEGEVLVIDNASTDRSGAVAAEHGARVVVESRRGYGSAYLCGLREAHGEFLVLLDADGTYPAEMIGDFVRAMRDGGADMVVGNRFGGQMAEGAMPWMNRYIGNPILSGMTRALFRIPLKDIHCGMRGMRRQRVPDLALESPGMEFATEMIVKAYDRDLHISEVVIPYRPRIGDSKLNPFRDAWRHTEYMLVFSPAILFLLPGAGLFLLGLVTQILLLSGPRALLDHTWNVHTNVLGLAASLTGLALFSLGLVDAHFARSIGMEFRHSPVSGPLVRGSDRPWRLAGVGLLLVGLLGWLVVVGQWVAMGFGYLSAIPTLTLATTALVGGVELLCASFVVHVMRLRR